MSRDLQTAVRRHVVVLAETDAEAERLIHDLQRGKDLEAELEQILRAARSRP